MDIHSIIQDDKKKKLLIILLVLLFLLIGFVSYFIIGSGSNAPQDKQGELLSDFALLAPREGTNQNTLDLLPKIALSTDHIAIAPGQTSKISWTSQNATTCVNIDGDELGLTGSISVTPKEPYTFDILCTGPNGTDLQSLTILVTTSPIIRLSAYPEAVISGEQAFIIWETTNADRCVDSTGKTLRLSDRISISPKTAYTFSMSCTGPKGTTNKSITVAMATKVGTSGGTSGSGSTSGSGTSGATTSGTLYPGTSSSPTVTFSAYPSTVSYGGTATISWSLKNVTYCVITSDGPLTGLPPFTYTSDSRTVSGLTKTQTYTISCTKGASKTEKSVTVTVGQKPLASGPDTRTPFYPDKYFAATFEMVKFTWNISNAQSCTLNKGSEVLKSSLSANSSTSLYEKTEGTFTYTLVCTGEGGTITSDPVSVAFVDCTFKSGFGSTLVSDGVSKSVRGVVEKDPSSGRLMCTHTYGAIDWTATKFVNIWGWLSNAPFQIDRGEENLCRYTSHKKANAQGGETPYAVVDTEYHGKWKFISRPTAVGPTYQDCGGLYSTTYWDGNATPSRFGKSGITGKNLPGTGFISAGDCDGGKCVETCRQSPGPYFVTSIKCEVIN